MTLYDMYEIAWQEIDHRGTIVSKRRAFKSSSARATFAEKLIEKDSFYRILAYADPQ